MKDRVLLIEDSRSFAAVVLAHLEAAGFQATAASSLAECKQELAVSASRYFAAIVDLNLPDAPGGEAVDFVLSQQIPTLVFTSQINTELQESILSRGIADYSLKRGRHNVEYVTWMVSRLYRNQHMEVLVVDDSESSLTLLRRLLEIQSFKVHTAKNARDALQKLDSGIDFKIVITDAYMQGMDGFELITKIRETYSKKALFVLGVSALSDQETSVRFLKSGANDFIAKPFLPEEFFCRINQAADSIDMLRELSESNDKKDLLLGMAAHDIRNPLGIVKRAAEKLHERIQPVGRDADLIEMICNASDRLLELLDTLLELSRVENKGFSLKVSRFNLSAMIEEVLRAISGIAKEKQIDLISDINTSCYYNGDSVLVRQVIENLLSNAIKYSPNHTAVLISTQVAEENIYFSVLDNGPGIKPEEVDRLFKPFSKLSSEATGGESSTGLGLALCDRIVEAHGGEIAYRPNPAGGSEFYFRLPINEKV